MARYRSRLQCTVYWIDAMAIALLLAPSIIYLQYLIIRDCGWLALVRGSEIWWFFGYCN